MQCIHPVFHVSQLEPSVPNSIPNHTQPPPPPIEVNGEENFEVSQILDSKLDKCFKRSPLRYYIRWAGYEGTSNKSTWVLADNLAADKLIPAFHNRYLDKPGPSTGQ